MSERAHHDFGPSTWPDRQRCPDFKPDGKSSDAAARGTRIHELWHQVATDQTATAADYEELICATWAANLIKDLAKDNPVTWETKLESTEPEYFGYSDCFWTEDDGATLVICDGKSGQGNPEQYMQLVGYGHAYMQHHPECTAMVGHFLYWDMRKLKTFALSRDEVLNTVERFLDHIATGEAKTGLQCTWCQRWDRCDAIRGAAFRSWMAVSNPDSIADTPEKLSELKSDLKLMEKIKEKVDGLVKDRLFTGQEVPGYKMHPRAGSSYVDPNLVWSYLEAEGVALADYLQCVKPDVTKLQALSETVSGEKLPEQLVEQGAPIHIVRKSK